MYDNKENVLTLKDSNLYAGGTISYYEDGTAELERPARRFRLPAENRYYTVRAGDQLDDIAWRHYKDEVPEACEFWWLIADANEIENPLDLSEHTGRELVIPDIFAFKLIADQD